MMIGRYLAGVLLMVLGGVGDAFSLYTIYNDMNPGWFETGYTYTAPFTEHESMMIAAVVVSTALIVIGLIMLCLKGKDS